MDRDYEVGINPLSSREHAILMLIAEGQTNEQIGQQLHLSLNTVKWYLKNIFIKLGVSNRTQAAQVVTKQRDLLPTPSATQASFFPPHLLSEFIGRQQELEQLGQWLQSPNERLITLLGLGGVGKTSLAIQTAHRYGESFKDGVYFIPLAALDSAQHVFREMTSLLGLGQSISDPLVDLTSYFRHKQALLILDNLDHLTEVGSQLVRLLEQSAQLKVLVTSREALHVRGERLLALQGLAAQGTHSEAVQLFERLARKAWPAFDPTPQDYHEIAAITQLIDGLPLAIELASNWVGILPLATIQQQIQSSLALLTSDMADLPPRHRSLQAILHYTWQTLPTSSKHILNGLAVFRADFTYDQAEAVTGASPGVFRHLLNKALLQQSGHERFRLHALVRQFVLVQLTPAQQGDYALRHAQHFLAVLQPEVKRLNSELNVQMHSPLVHERENLFQAWQTILESGRHDLMLPMLDLGYWIDMAGWWHEGLDLIQQTLPKLDDTLLQGRLYFFHTLLSFRLNDLPSVMQHGEACVTCLTATPYQVEAAVALGITAIFETLFNSPEAAHAKMQRSYALLTPEALQERPSIWWVIRAFEGSIYMLTGNTPKVIEYFEEIIHTLPDSADWLTNISYVNLGEAYWLNGDLPRARQTLLKGYQKGLAAKDALVTIGAAYYLHQIDRAQPFSTQLQALVDHFGSASGISRAATYQGTFALIRQQHHSAQGFLMSSLQVLYLYNEWESLQSQALQVANLLPNTTLAERLTALLEAPTASAWDQFFNFPP